MLDAGDAEVNRTGRRLEDLLVGCRGRLPTMATALHALTVALDVSNSVGNDWGKVLMRNLLELR